MVSRFQRFTNLPSQPPTITGQFFNRFVREGVFAPGGAEFWREEVQQA
jgi:hypothetical protein